jgi:hypothetical protein
LRRSSLIKGRPSFVIEYNNSFKTYEERKTKEVKPFKLTNESINCEVDTCPSSILENNKDLNVGLWRIAEASPALVISSHFNIMTSSRYLQLLNKWKSDWLLMGNPERLTLRSLISASERASTPST